MIPFLPILIIDPKTSLLLIGALAIVSLCSRMRRFGGPRCRRSVAGATRSRRAVRENPTVEVIDTRASAVEALAKAPQILAPHVPQPTATAPNPLRDQNNGTANVP